MEVPRSVLSKLKAGFVSSAQTGLETALLKGRPHRGTECRHRLWMSMPGSSTGDAWKSPGRRGPGRALPSRSAGHRRERLVAGVNLRAHAEPVQHSCRTTSAPMLNRFYLFYSSFSSSFFYLPMGYHSRPHLSDRQKPADLSVGAHPGFSPPDSGSWWQAAPRSPRRLIGLPSARKPSPAKGFPKLVPLPVCAADDVGAGYGLALTCEVSSSVAACVGDAA